MSPVSKKRKPKNRKRSRKQPRTRAAARATGAAPAAGEPLGMFDDPFDGDEWTCTGCGTVHTLDWDEEFGDTGLPDFQQIGDDGTQTLLCADCAPAPW